MDPRSPGAACTSGQALCNEPDRCRVGARGTVPSSSAAIGRPHRWPMRTVLDAILYVLRTGCAWRHLPRDFTPWQTVLRWFLRVSRSGTFERLAHALTMADRERMGREASPTAAVLDAQSARSGGVGMKGGRG